MRYPLLFVGLVMMLVALPALAQDAPPAQATPGAAETAQALATAAAEERTQRQDTLRATAQALIEQDAPSDDEIEATTAELLAALPVPVQSLDDEQTAAVLGTLAERGSVAVDEEALTVVYAVQEQTVNVALTSLLDEGGYAPSAVGVDFIPEGVIITLEDAAISAEQTGRVVVFAEFDSDGGRVGVTVIFASLDDAPLSPEAVEGLDDVLRRALAESLVLLADAPVNYTVTDAITTDESLVINLSVPFAVAG